MYAYIILDITYKIKIRYYFRACEILRNMFSALLFSSSKWRLIKAQTNLLRIILNNVP